MLKKDLFLKKLTFLNFLILFLIVIESYSQIKINHWIHQPDEETLQKPLIYIDFWATWCAPCISSMPHTKALENRFGDKVLFVFISDEPENKIRNFMNQKKYDFYTANDTAHYNYDYFNIKSIPFAVLLNHNGKLIWQGKPWELNDQKLKKFIALYGQKKAKSDRIKLQEQATDFGEEKYVSGNKFALKYKTFDYDIPYKQTFKAGQIIYQGNLKRILAKMLQVEPYQILFQNDVEQYYEVKFDAQFEDRQAKVAELFLSSAGLKWEIVDKAIEIYSLKEQDTSNWLSQDLYQYTDSPQQSLSMMDDYFLTIDNASPGQLARIMSEKTPWIFVYEGQNNNVYDWNIQIDTFDHLFNNLISDLDFNIRQTTKILPVYMIRKKND